MRRKEGGGLEEGQRGYAKETQEGKEPESVSWKATECRQCECARIYRKRRSVEDEEQHITGGVRMYQEGSERTGKGVCREREP